MRKKAPRLVVQWSWQGFPASASWVQAQRTRLSSPRCLTCLLGLQGVQWVRELVVVCVSWPGHPGLKKNEKKKSHSFCEGPYFFMDLFVG